MHESDVPLTLGNRFGHIRWGVQAETTALLGDTISLTQEHWAEPSFIPGWTRSHVAAHLAAGAAGLTRVIKAYLADEANPSGMYDSAAARHTEIEKGACLNPLELQIWLDSMSGQLEQVMDSVPVTELQQVVVLRPGWRVPLELLPLARLNEVVLHHFDLRVGFDFYQVENDLLQAILSWQAWLLTGREDYPPLHLTDHTGETYRLGGSGTPIEVKASTAALLGWITRGLITDELKSAPRLPNLV